MARPAASQHSAYHRTRSDFGDVTHRDERAPGPDPRPVMRYLVNFQRFFTGNK